MRFAYENADTYALENRELRRPGRARSRGARRAGRSVPRLAPQERAAEIRALAARRRSASATACRGRISPGVTIPCARRRAKACARQPSRRSRARPSDPGADRANRAPPGRGEPAVLSRLSARAGARAARKRAKALVNRLEDWVGKLTPAQLQRVRDYADRAPIADELRDRDRKRLQGDVLAILRAREAQAPSRAARQLRHGREPAYRRARRLARTLLRPAVRSGPDADGRAARASAVAASPLRGGLRGARAR